MTRSSHIFSRSPETNSSISSPTSLISHQSAQPQAQSTSCPQPIVLHHQRGVAGRHVWHLCKTCWCSTRKRTKRGWWEWKQTGGCLLGFKCWSIWSVKRSVCFIQTCVAASLLVMWGCCFPFPADSTCLACPSSTGLLTSTGPGLLSGLSLTTLLPWRDACTY